MSREVILRLGPVAAGMAREVVEADVVPLLRAGRGGEALYLVRGELRRRRLRAQALEASGGGAFDLPFRTLEGFVRARHAALAGARRRLVTAVERRVLLEEVLGGRAWPGHVERLGQFFHELGEAGVLDGPALEARLAALGRDLGDRDREVVQAFSRYSALLDERGLADPERALAAVAGAEPPALALLAIDGFYQLPPLVRKLLERLAARAARTVFLLDDEAEEPSEALRDAVSFACSLGARLERRSAEAAAPGEVLARRIFGPAAAAALPPVPAGDRLRLLRAETRSGEVEAIARAIREIAAREPWIAADLSRVGVVFPEIERYAPIVRELFPRAGIPFALLHGEPLQAAAAPRLVLEMIEAVLSRFDRAPLARVLLAPCVDFRAADGRRLDAGRLERIAREAGIAGPIGREGWWARLDAHRERLAREAKGGRDRRRARRDLAVLEAGRPVLAEALAALAGLEGPAPAGERQRLLLDLLDRFGVSGRLLATDGGAAGPPPPFSAVVRDAAAQRALADILGDVARGLGPAAVSLERYAVALRAAFAGATFLAGEGGGAGREGRGRVPVLGRLDVRGLRFDHLFLGGLDARSFPGTRAADIFYREDERRALGLATARDHLAEMRYVFASALGAGARSVTLSYPAEGAAEPAARSPFLFDLVRLVEGGLPAVSAAPPGPRTSAPEPAVARAVAVASARLDSEEPGPFEGRIEGAALARLRAAIFAGGRARISPSALERYAACPFRAFAERHLRLAPLPEVEEEVSAREVGEIVHRILRRFYEGFPRGSGEGWIAAASERMLAIALEEIATERQDLFFRARARDLVAGLDGGGDGRKGVLRAFVEQEAAGDGRRPVALEAEVALEIESGGLRVRAGGVVDRVDAAPDGSAYVVFDYKTGWQAPDVREILDGLSFQLPIYLLAARSLVGSAARPLGAAYYPLKDPRDVRPLWFAEKGRVDAGRRGKGLVPDLPAALARVPLAVGAVLQAMAGGLFHPGALPSNRKGCGYCEFRRLCRVDDGRMERIGTSRARGLFRPVALAEEGAAAPEDGHD